MFTATFADDPNGTTWVSVSEPSPVPNDLPVLVEHTKVRRPFNETAVLQSLGYRRCGPERVADSGALKFLVEPATR